ncbi:MAG TPA: amidohydrolase family protein [Candidatus Acidoferrum sp.]|nr:amidohydrolase family protein [Candidatus Acidoferrum sp.]
MRSRKILLSLLLTFLFVPFFSLAEPSSQLAITHVTVIDSTGRPPQTEQTVLIEGGRITAVGATATIKVPKAARTIDASGKFLLPGFWDMHVHLAGVNADPPWSKQVLLPLLLANGITGVRDMGGDLDALLAWQRDIESGALLAPHIVAAGPFLAASGKRTPEQYPVYNAEEARAAVDDLKKRGANFIKIITLPSRDAFFAVADESKKQNIPFVGHLPFEIGVIEASDAGMHSIEHLLYSAFALSFSSKETELRPRLVQAEKDGDSASWEQIAHEADATYSPEKAAILIQTLKKNGTWVTPTLASLDITSHPGNWKTDDPLLAFVPPAMAKQWRDSFDDVEMKQRAAWLGRQAANDWKLTGELHRAGVPLLVGSDSLDPFVFPGDSFHHELAEMVRAGFSPMEALQAATRGAAVFLGREKDFGTVETGRAADLVLLSANPVDNIANTRKVSAIIRNGSYYDRASLDTLLARAKDAAAAVSEENP